MTTLIEIVGWAGALLVLGAYILLSLNKISSNSVTYQLMNVIGSVGFIINSGWNKAYPSAALNVAWALIGIYALQKIKSAGTNKTTIKAETE